MPVQSTEKAAPKGGWVQHFFYLLFKNTLKPFKKLIVTSHTQEKGGKEGIKLLKSFPERREEGEAALSGQGSGGGEGGEEGEPHPCSRAHHVP